MLGKKIPHEIPALGSISTPDALALQGFWKTEDGIYDGFKGKVIIDVGAWISDFLEVLSVYSYPERLIAVDPIYEREGEYKKAIERTQKLIHELRIVIGKWWDGNKNDETSRMLESLDERQRVIDTAESRRLLKWVEYLWRLSPSDIASADYIFITFLLEHLPDWKWFLENIERHMKVWWKIIITDFLIRPPIQLLWQNMKFWESTLRIIGKDERKRVSLEISR